MAGPDINNVEASEMGSNLSGNSSIITSSHQATRGRGENIITRIDRELYNAAVNGNFNDLDGVENIDNLLTPNKNAVLHIHLTSQETHSVSGQFVEKILSKPKCRDLVLQPNVKGETPLHMAARYGHSSIVKLLIDCAKDIEDGIGAEKLLGAKNRENDTALHEAVRYNHVEVVEILIELDSHYSYSANNANETPLYLASERQYKHIVRMILEKLKSPPAYDGPNGRTALHAAVINNDRGSTISCPLFIFCCSYILLYVVITY